MVVAYSIALFRQSRLLFHFLLLTQSLPLFWMQLDCVPPIRPVDRTLAPFGRGESAPWAGFSATNEMWFIGSCRDTTDM
jgi:hypothetical protein